MLNIFYQNKTLNDTLIINVSLNQSTNIETKGDIAIGYNNKEILFINIANSSKNIGQELICNGLLFPNNKLLEKIKSLTNIDLSQYMNNGFKVALIEQCEDIKGTHLHKCKVNVGNEVLDVVCGAPNARVGLKTVCATNGTMLPDGKPIISGSLLGNKSDGMLCSYRELKINKESKGIIELDDSFKVGDYFMEVYANNNK